MEKDLYWNVMIKTILMEMVAAVIVKSKAGMSVREDLLIQKIHAHFISLSK